MWDIYLYLGLLVLCLLIGAVNYGKLSINLKILGVVVTITLCVEGYAFYLMNHDTNNLYLYQILIPAQYALLALLYYYSISGAIERRFILFSIAFFLLVISPVMLSFQKPDEFNSYARVLKNLLLAGFSMLYYRGVFLGLRVTHLEKDPIFWVSTGIFFYSLGTVFVDGLMHYMLGMQSPFTLTLYYINIFLGLLLNITYLISFIVSAKNGLGDN